MTVKGRSRKKEMQYSRMKTGQMMASQRLITLLNPRREDEDLEPTNQRRRKIDKGICSATIMESLDIFLMCLHKKEDKRNKRIEEETHITHDDDYDS